MLIGIDGNEANVEKRVGVGEYAFQVLVHLYKTKNLELRTENRDVKFIIYLKDKPRSDLPKETSWWRYKVFGPKKLWTQAALPVRLFLEKEKPDVFFTPSHYAPRFSPCPTVISIMDLSFVFFPEMFDKKDLYQLKSWTEYSVRKADRILTISSYSKKAIIDYYKIPEDKIVVTYPGYNQELRIKNLELRTKDIRKIKNKYNINGDYILFVGTLQPRKNIIRLIEAFNKLRTKNLELRTLKLTIVGKKGWLFNDIFRRVKELNIEDQIIFTDYVSEDDLPILYKGAECLVNPSLYEGFGLPVVEAMACGCPVVVSNASSLPEIVGDVGILINPESIENIAEGIYKIISDDQLKTKLIQKGLARAKLFSWEECAKRTLQVLINKAD